MTSAVSQRSNSNATAQTSFLQQRLESIWYEGGAGKQLLYPLELLYRTLAYLDGSIKKAQSVKHPISVIVVGNISVGGTGKTPLVVYLCELLKEAGYSPGIITRGYGGKSTHWPAVVNADSSPVDFGDEPVLMARRTNVPVVAGPNRNHDIETLLAQTDVDVVISDDGLQHYRLQRDIEIAVIDQVRGLGNQRCLPAGPLREPAKRLKQCDFVVMHELEPAADYSMQLKAQFVHRLNSDIQQPLPDWQARTVHAVTGIGNPARFFQMLKSFGLDVIEHSFPDHYQFSESDIVFEDELTVVMTEKDAVKCRAFAADQHWFVPVSAVLNQRFSQDLLAKLKIIAAEKSQSRTFKDYQHMNRKLLDILVCPVTKGRLKYDKEKQELISRSARLAYPIIDGKPIMIESDARVLTQEEVEKL